MIYLIFSTALFLSGLFLIHWIHNQHHLDIVVEPVPPPARAPLISVCVPARNEELNIRTCIRSLLAQDYPELEVIVLDDRSTDGTATILRELAAQDGRLRVLSGTDLPEGWAGKPHALYQAARAARADPSGWLCFVDADTFAAPNALSACLAKALETDADLFTILTFQVTGTFWEKVVMPLVMTALSVGFSPRRVNDPARKDAIANGQFILIKRAVYDAIGGHESVRDQIVEDKAIAERVKWSGHHLVIADGHAVVRTRMYTSLPEMWEGWTKNIYLGLRDRPSLLLLGALGALVTLLTAVFLPIWPLLGLLWLLNGGGWLALAVILESLVLWMYVLWTRARVNAAMDIPSLYSLTVPVGAAIFAAMMLTSAWKVLSGQGVTWKGRTYTQG